MFSDVTQMRLICLIYSLLHRIFVSQKALEIRQVCGRSLLVSVSVSICVFSFELQLDSCPNIFRVSWSVSALLVLVYKKLLLYEMLRMLSSLNEQNGLMSQIITSEENDNTVNYLGQSGLYSEGNHFKSFQQTKPWEVHWP